MTSDACILFDKETITRKILESVKIVCKSVTC